MKGKITSIKKVKNMDAKLDFSKAGISQESNQSLTYYAFMAVHLEMIKEGATVDGLRIEFDGVVKDSVAGFREFLTRISSLNYDTEKLTTPEKETINKIVMYLSEPVVAEVKTAKGSYKSMREVLAQHMPKR